MRIKAHMLGMAAEDYFNDKVLEDTDLLYSGTSELPADFWDKHGKGMESWQQGGHTYYRLTGPHIPTLLTNEFVHLEKKDEAPFYAIVKDIRARRLCCPRSRTTRTRRTTSGASRRATASRTSRSTCS